MLLSAAVDLTENKNKGLLYFYSDNTEGNEFFVGSDCAPKFCQKIWAETVVDSQNGLQALAAK